MAREEDLKRSGAWDWYLQRPLRPRDQDEVVFCGGDEVIFSADAESIILSIVEEYYGSGKAMQVADILKEGE